MANLGANTFDYIVCGGGTAGCTVAGRLAEDPDVTVLLIEAGEHSDDVPDTTMAGGAMQIVGNPVRDWNILDSYGKGVKGRRIPLSRAKVLGGSSTVNGTLCIRGLKADYDDWGLDGWSGAEVFDYMAKAETLHDKEWFDADKAAHGHQGPIHTEPHDLAPISTRMLESFKSKGIPFESDMFSTGETANGCGHVVRTVHSGFRMTATNYVTKANLKGNVTVLTHTLIDKVQLDLQNEELRATGVEVLQSNQKQSYAASKEVILTAGAYGSPAILLRSGVGSHSELSKHGIKQLLDLPGVGRNLQDHLIAHIFYEVSEPGLTTDDQIWHSQDAISKAMKQWQNDHTGFLASWPFGCFAFTRLDDRLADSDAWQNAASSGRDAMGQTLKQPSIEFWNTECYSAPAWHYKDFPTKGGSSFAIVTELFSPRSRGTVSLKSTDPSDNPVVDHHYLEDPLDTLILAEGCKLGNEIVMEGAGTKDIIKGAWPANLTHHTYTKREEWENFVREEAMTCYHPACTCPMGKDRDPMAVLDDKLRVRGVKNLRVADASSLPKLPNGHTQMVVYAVAEKAADLLKAEYAKK